MEITRHLLPIFKVLSTDPLLTKKNIKLKNHTINYDIKFTNRLKYLVTFVPHLLSNSHQGINTKSRLLDLRSQIISIFTFLQNETDKIPIETISYH